MAFVKALFVVLLSHSASFGESERLENDSISKKATAATGTTTTTTTSNSVPEKQQAYDNAETLKDAVRRATGKSSGQLGYVYLQPKFGNKVWVIPSTMAKALNEADSLPASTSPWPSTTNTNFRFSFVDYGKPRKTNYGHPEYQLLKDDALLSMVKTKNVGCPKYVILYSSNLPCYKPANPNSLDPRCGELTVTAKNNFAEICPDATFYLYTDFETGNNLPDKKKTDFLVNSGIVWIHRDMDKPLA